MSAFTPFTDADLDSSVVELFEKQVARVPQRTAVDVGGRALSYVELDVAANRLAHGILRQCSGAPLPVCVLVQDPVLQIVAMLGILKAGHFYVMLEGRDPPGRLAAIYGDAKPGLVVYEAATLTQAKELVAGRAPLIGADEASRDPSLASRQPNLSVTPDALVNLMYTSGSTGKPKGVMQTHRTLIHCVKTTHNRLRHTEDDRMALLSPPTVGVSAAMLFAGLLIGAAVMPFDVRRQGIERLAEWLQRERATSTYSLPSVIRGTFSLLPSDCVLPDLRYVKLGGEAVYRSDVALFQRHLRPDSVVQITLGTTETYAITWWHLRQFDSAEGFPSVLPVGHAEDDSDVLVIDEAGAPVAQGGVGEIVIRNAYLSPGYWNQPELTQATYADLDDGRREYRTGDLGRVLPDGKLQHLGRKDFVVKVNGYLVAPTEVEIAVREVRGVKDAAVVGRAAPGGAMRLVAYIETVDAVEPGVSEMRRELASKLPAHMVPGAFVRVERLPRLPNGKLDPRSLPSDSVGTVRSQPYAAPTSPLEVQLVAIWQDVLGVERVGIDDDFAELGGDSLRAMHVLARAGQAFGVELPFDVLIEAHTVATLAKAVSLRLASSLDADDMDALLREVEELSDEEVGTRLVHDSASGR